MNCGGEACYLLISVGVGDSISCLDIPFIGEPVPWFTESFTGECDRSRFSLLFLHRGLPVIFWPENWILLCCWIDYHWKPSALSWISSVATSRSKVELVDVSIEAQPRGVCTLCCSWLFTL